MAFYWWNEHDDGAVGVRPELSLHRAGQADEYVRAEVSIRVPWYRSRKVWLVARTYQGTNETTLALESIRVASR